MPVDEEGKVHFKTTLFALIRINLQIFMRSMEEMDQADQVIRINSFKICMIYHQKFIKQITFGGLKLARIASNKKKYI